MDGVVVAILL